MTKKNDTVSEAGAVELTEDALDQVTGGTYTKHTNPTQNVIVPSTDLKSAVVNKYSDPATIIQKV